MQIAGWMRRALCAALVVCLAAGSAAAQGVTTGSMGGVVTDAQGAVVPGATVIAIHEPSGTSYEAVTQADGRFAIVGMRVGGLRRLIVPASMAYGRGGAGTVAV